MSVFIPIISLRGDRISSPLTSITLICSSNKRQWSLLFMAHWDGHWDGRFRIEEAQENKLWKRFCWLLCWCSVFPTQQDKGEEASGSTKPAPLNQPPPSSRPPHRWHVIARHWLRQTRRRTSGVLPVTSRTRRTQRIPEPEARPASSCLSPEKPVQLEEQTCKHHWTHQRQHTAACADALFIIASGFQMDEFRWGYCFFIFSHHLDTSMTG